MPIRLFAGVDLAGRVERAECRLLTDSAAAVARRRPEVPVTVVEVGGGVATYTGEGSPLNKVAGLGFDEELDPRALEVAERVFDARRSPVQVELSNLADASIAPFLSARGYGLQGFENVLGRALDDLPSPAGASGIEVAPSDPDELARWLDIVVDGFASPDEQGIALHEEFPREVLERVIGDMADADGFERYLARVGGRPVGGASMRLHDGVAQLCGAATLPAFRRRGVQGALLARRLADAREAGCDVAVVTTQPGSKSQQNAQRQGFELLYTRAVLVRGPRG
jgi:ribosomal protein S18 acetylase RimI-like enzyme